MFNDMRDNIRELGTLLWQYGYAKAILIVAVVVLLFLFASAVN